MKNRSLALVAVGALAAGGALAATSVGGADHLDAPGVAADGRTDINDLFVFASGDATTLILTVNPGAGAISGTSFRPGADYDFNIDTNGDAIADKVVNVKFNGSTKKGQKFKVELDGGGPELRGQVGTTTSADGLTATAGVFDDPFFFDLEGFQNGFGFDGTDFFAGLNVSAIVLDVPTSWIGNDGDAVGVWATTSVDDEQVDRIGRPAINTVLIPAEQKDAFNEAEPVDDPAEYTDEVVATLLALGNTQERAEAIAAVLLPDVTTFTLGDTSGFLNGRQLADDVIDAELNLLSNGAVTTDMVDANDADFLGEFPYLAPAN